MSTKSAVFYRISIEGPCTVQSLATSLYDGQTHCSHCEEPLEGFVEYRNEIRQIIDELQRQGTITGTEDGYEFVTPEDYEVKS